MTTTNRHQWAVAAALGIYVVLACRQVLAGGIHDPIRINDLKAVKTLVARDPGVIQSRGEDGVTPLHEAVRYGDAEMVKFLIAHGADVKARCYNAFTPLHLTDDAGIARILIRNGADPKSSSWVGTVLDNAVRDENLEVIDVLLEAGETLTFEQLVELGRTDRVAKMLKEQPSLAKTPRCLHAAAHNGRLEIARLLLDNGADPNLDFGRIINIPGPYTPFSDAVLAREYEIAKLLCERGAKMAVSGGKFYDNLLHEAVATRDIRFVQLMLEHGANPNSQKNRLRPMSPLHLAANIGDIKKCKLLIEHKTDVNARTPDGATPLMFAMAWGHDEVCDYLLSSGAELDIHAACALGKTAEARRMLHDNPTLANDRDRRLHRTPLFWAAGRGHVPLVELLIQYKADVNARALPYGQAGNVVTGPEIWDRDLKETKDGETPLHLAAGAGHTAVVRILLERGAKIDAIDAGRTTPLQRAVESEHADTVRFLLEKNAMAGSDEQSASLLSGACDNPEIMKLLLSHRPGPKAINEALRIAAIRNAKVAELLLTQGAKADVYTACILGQSARVAELVAADSSLVDRPQSDYPRERPLVLAARNGRARVVELLLDKDSAIDPKKGTSALVAAAGSGQLEVVRLLLARGADINRKDSMGTTALQSAAAGGHLDVVVLLIRRGAHVLATDVYHATALHAAARKGNVDIARELINAGVPVDCRNDFRETPLHVAASEGHAELAAFLLKVGADVNAKNRRGKTPLLCAEQIFDPIFHSIDRDRKSVAALLCEHGGLK
jgi:ankyrin repeat protein